MEKHFKNDKEELFERVFSAVKFGQLEISNIMEKQYD